MYSPAAAMYAAAAAGYPGYIGYPVQYYPYYPTVQPSIQPLRPTIMIPVTIPTRGCGWRRLLVHKTSPAEAAFFESLNNNL